MTLHAWKAMIDAMKVKDSQLFEYLQPLIPNCKNPNNYSIFIGRNPKEVAAKIRSGNMLGIDGEDPYARVLDALKSRCYLEYRDYLLGVQTKRGDRRKSLWSGAFRDSFDKALLEDFRDSSADFSCFWNDLNWLFNQMKNCEGTAISEQYAGVAIALVICTALMGPDIEHLGNLGYSRLGRATPTPIGQSMGTGLRSGKTALLSYVTFPAHNLALFSSTDKKVKLHQGDCVYVGKQPPADESCTLRITVEGDDASSVSKLHCVIRQSNGAWQITDLSRKGTSLLQAGVERLLRNGESRALHHGDIICLGRESEGFRFEIRE